MQKIQPPIPLSADARAIFDKTLTKIAKPDQIHHEYLLLIAMQSEFIDQFVKLTATLKEEGPIVIGSKGQPMTNPLVRQKKEALDTVMRVTKELSRAGILIKPDLSTKDNVRGEFDDL